MRNRTEVIILQHPRERFHPIGTARFAALGLSRVRLLTGAAKAHSGATSNTSFPPGTALLYPAPDAQRLDTLPPHRRPSALVVLDGTWHHARTLYRDIPELARLPHYALSPSTPSRYRLRKEPRADYVSTIEAIVQALTALEPETPHLPDLLRAFDRMIDRQLESQPTVTLGRVRRKRRPPSICRISRLFTDDFQRAVIGYAEGVTLPSGQRLLVQWTAQRVDTGEYFQAVLQAGLAASGCYLHHMGLAGFSGPLDSTESFSHRWQDFVKPTDTLLTWNQSGVELLETVCLWRGRQAFLKACYHALPQAVRPPSGALEDLVAAEGLSAPPAPVAGRAGGRLGNARALAEHLYRLGRPR